MRSKILYLIAAAYFLAGFRVYQIKATTDQLKAADPTVQAHLDLLTVHQVGWLFMGTAIVSAGVVLYEDMAPHAKWAVRLKSIAFGYSLMTFVLMFWTALYALSWVENGDWHALYGIGNYGLTVGILLLCSKIVELPDKRAVSVPILVAAVEHDLAKDAPAVEEKPK